MIKVYKSNILLAIFFTEKKAGHLGRWVLNIPDMEILQIVKANDSGPYPLFVAAGLIYDVLLNTMQNNRFRHTMLKRFSRSGALLNQGSNAFLPEFEDNEPSLIR